MVNHALSKYLLVSTSYGLEDIADPFLWVVCSSHEWKGIIMGAEERDQLLQKLPIAQITSYILKHLLHIN